jgi:hypothetical protein
MICGCCDPNGSQWLAVALKHERRRDMDAESEKWIARRRLIAGGKAFHAGTEVPASALGRNARELERTGYVWRAPAHQPVAGLQPVDLPPPPKPKKKPMFGLVTKYDSPVQNWKATFERAVKLFDGDAAKARDWMDSHPEARALYLLACRVGCAEEAAKRGVVSVSPDMIGL